jgi:hypothetical protein
MAPSPCPFLTVKVFTIIKWTTHHAINPNLFEEVC